MGSAFQMKKLSRRLTGLMLAAFLLLLGAGALMGALKGRSYIAAFVFALALFALGTALRGKLSRWEEALESLGPGKTGALLAALCLAVNLSWVLFFSLEPTVDYQTFWTTACELAEGKPLSLASYVAMFPHILGYSTFLSLPLRLFGVHTQVAALLNVALTVGSGILLYSLCLRWRDMKTAVFASLLWTFCPSKLLYNTMVLSEPAYTFLLLGFLWLVSEAERGGKRLPALCLAGIGSGLLLRAFNAMRPVAAILIIALFLWLLLLRERAHSSAGRWAIYLLLTLAVYAVTASPWERYEASVLGEEPAGLSGYNIYVGFNPQSNGSYAQEDIDLLFHYRYDVYGSAAQAQEKMLEEAKARLTSGGIDFPRLFLLKLRTLLGNDEGGAYYSLDGLSPWGYSLLAVLSNIYYYLLIFLTLKGTLNIWREDRRSCLLLAPLYTLGLTLAHMLAEVSGRYHYSVIPMLVMIAAFSCGGKDLKHDNRPQRTA